MKRAMFLLRALIVLGFIFCLAIWVARAESSVTIELDAGTVTVPGDVAPKLTRSISSKPAESGGAIKWMEMVREPSCSTTIAMDGVTVGTFRWCDIDPATKWRTVYPMRFEPHTTLDASARVFFNAVILQERLLVREDGVSP